MLSVLQSSKLKNEGLYLSGSLNVSQATLCAAQDLESMTTFRNQEGTVHTWCVPEMLCLCVLCKWVEVWCAHRTAFWSGKPKPERGIVHYEVMGRQREKG